jgi:L,D-transpeptidase YcbB
MRVRLGRVATVCVFIAGSVSSARAIDGTVTVPAGSASVVAPVPLPISAVHARLSERRERSLSGPADDIKAISAFYDRRAGVPLFADTNGLTTTGKAVWAEFGRADDWGLPSAELVPAKISTGAAPLAAAEVAEVEAQLALAVLKYARFARGGRIAEPSKQLATYIDRAPQLLDAKVVLETVANADKADVAMTKFHPQDPAFEVLRQAYNEARKLNKGDEDARIFPAGPSLKPGMKHSQIALLRERMKVSVPASDEGPGNAALYDQTLKTVVVAFQEANGLDPADGIVGGRTRAALNSLNPPSARKLLANMEQWRWMPPDLGATRIVVNIPEFTVRMFENTTLIHTERIVAGLVTNQTPIFSDALQTVVLQPDWILPESIKVNEALPSLMGRGGMFWSNGLKIKRGEKDVDPRSINWSSANLKAYTFYQPPGEANVLGQVKFLFPNKHAVYMHDTPSKHLFQTPVRAYSHGCMRVRNPVKLAELILFHDKGWTAAKVRQLLEDGPEDNKIALDHKIPVHVTYFTTVPDASGKIKNFADLYGHEERISLALEGNWGDIDIPADHLAPIEDREFEFRSSANERRREVAEERYQQAKGGNNEFEKALKNIFGGF